MTNRQIVRKVTEAQRRYNFWKRCSAWILLATCVLAVLGFVLSVGLSGESWITATVAIGIVVAGSLACTVTLGLVFSAAAVLDAKLVASYISILLEEPVTVYRTKRGRWAVRHSGKLRVEAWPLLNRFFITSVEVLGVCDQPRSLRAVLDYASKLSSQLVTMPDATVS